MKLVITGATGYLGRELIRQLSSTNEYELFAATSDVQKAAEKFTRNNVKVITNEHLIDNRGGVIDEQCVIIHAAFCRRAIGTNLALSLDFSRRLYQAAIARKAAGIVNLSSQSVYGSQKGALGDENAQLNPDYLYALAKCGSEQLLKEALYFSDGRTFGCSIRMASLMGPTDTVPDNVLYKFVCSAYAGEDISIVGGTQRFSFLDIRDAVQAIVLLLKQKPCKWKEIYNLGPVRQTCIIEMAECIRDEVEKHTGKRVEIVVHPDRKHELNAGMDSSLLYRDLEWMPHYDFFDIVRNTICFVTKRS